MEYNSQLAFLGIRLSSITKDSISVGLIYIENETVKVFISEEKMKLVKSIIKPELHNFFDSAIRAYQKNESRLTLNDIIRAHVYQNGIIKITKPSPIAFPNDSYTIEAFFERAINDDTTLKLKSVKKENTK
jgi:L,D-peptidoglycan transpeptidase YkuD (ErfK/YbiS/YcfS/YnhG family)